MPQANAVSEKRFAVAASDASRSRALSSRKGERIIPDPVTRNVAQQAATMRNQGRRPSAAVMGSSLARRRAAPKRFPRVDHAPRARG
jgi:hypothetical protein